MSSSVTRSLTQPSRLSQITKRLQRQPSLVLPNVKALKVKLALRNDHFGARHFVKEELPRVRYANPELDIEVQRVPKLKTDNNWDAEMELRFNNGEEQRIVLSDLWSTAIVRKMMDLAGGDSWSQWRAHALEAGVPVVPGEELEGQPTVQKPRPQKPTPPWKLARAKNLAEKLKAGQTTSVGSGAMQEQSERDEKGEVEGESGEPRVKKLAGPGAVQRPSEKPKTLRGSSSTLP